jgi:hypothetical protein
MSSNEKAINRYDLEAYKNYDSRHFSLVPGIHHNKYNSLSKPNDNDPEFAKMEYNEKLNYLKGIGYNPGVGATRNHPQTVGVPSDIPTLGF